MLFRGTIYTILIFLLSLNGFAAKQEIKSGNAPEKILFKKTSNNLINHTEALRDSGYSILEEPVLNLGFYKGGVWVKFKKSEKDLLTIEHPPLDYGALFHLKKGNLIQIAEFGDELIHQKGIVNYRYPVVNLEGKVESGEELYLFVTNQGEQFYLPILFWDKNEFENFKSYEFPLFGTYFGVIIFAIFFNLFIALILKEKNILSYTLYLICLLILQASLNGFSGMWLWGDSTWWLNRANVIFASASIFFLLIFTLGFLPVKSNMPKAYFVINSSKYLVAINILTSIFVSTDFLIIPIIFINGITLLFGVLIIPISYIIYKKYFKEARYFLLAFILLIIGVFAFVLRNMGVIPNNFFSENGLQLGSSLEAILLTFAIIDKFKGFREQAINSLKEINLIKDKANQELELKVSERTWELERSNKQLIEQKDLVEEQNSEIKESINYGEKIQSAILPTINDIGRKVENAFVFFQPKDIVSGDFYWVSHLEEFSFYVVADCTGHGVPGAFMSMIGNTLLNQIINKDRIFEPHKILNQLKNEVIHSLSQKGEIGQPKDGMDLSLIRVNHKTNELIYAGANNPIYIVSNNGVNNDSADLLEDERALFVLKPDKHPIGFQSDEWKEFTYKEFQLNKDDEIYLFTDGYADQFGGEKGKKLKYKTFKQLLIKNGFENKKDLLEEFLLEWMRTKNIKNEPIFQVDDVCVLGIKI